MPGFQKIPLKNSNAKISTRPDLAYFVKKDNLHFSYVLEDALLGKDLVITSEKSKLKIFRRMFFLSKKEVLRKLTLQKTGWTGPG